MDDRDKKSLRKLYDLQMELFKAQGDEIEHLKRLLEEVGLAHNICVKLLMETGRLVDPDA